MRIIKFRAWHNIQKRMFWVRQLEWAPQGDAPFITDIVVKPLERRADENPNWLDRGDGYYIGDMELMQFTGLSDKNGKEIYEGDITKGSEHNFKIVFVNGCFGFVPINHKQPSGKELFIPTYKVEIIGEVIGNIYENPELLAHPDFNK